MLIADDDQVVRLFLSDVLTKVFGFEAEEAATVAKAAEKTASGAFDLVLIDRNLADGTLEDYCRKAARGGFRDVPKLVISGEKPLNWDEASMAGCGVFGYLLKPCRIDELKDMIGKKFPGSLK